MNETERKELIEEIVKEIVPVIVENVKKELTQQTQQNGETQEKNGGKVDYKNLVAQAMK